MRNNWYHSSPKRLPVGTVLTGVFAPSGPWEAKGKVFFTAEVTPHYTLIERAVRENWHIYQIMPLEKNIFWGSSLDEAGCLRAQIVKYVGMARGIVSQRLRSIPEKTKQKITKGVSHPKELLHCYVASRVTRHQVTQWNHSTKNRNSSRFQREPSKEALIE